MTTSQPLTDDDWSSHVMNGEAYVAEVIVFGVAGLAAQAQLYNPVGSGKRVKLRLVEQMAFAAIPINVNIRRYDVALAGLSAPPFGGPENLLGGGAAPVAQFRFDNPAVTAGSIFWLILSTGFTRKDYPTAWEDWGHEILPGQGILVTNGLLAGFIIAGWQWAEVPL